MSKQLAKAKDHQEISAVAVVNALQDLIAVESVAGIGSGESVRRSTAYSHYGYINNQFPHPVISPDFLTSCAGGARPFILLTPKEKRSKPVGQATAFVTFSDIEGPNGPYCACEVNLPLLRPCPDAIEQVILHPVQVVSDNFTVTQSAHDAIRTKTPPEWIGPVCSVDEVGSALSVFKCGDSSAPLQIFSLPLESVSIRAVSVWEARRIVLSLNGWGYEAPKVKGGPYRLVRMSRKSANGSLTDVSSVVGVTTVTKMGLRLRYGQANVGVTSGAYVGEDTLIAVGGLAFSTQAVNNVDLYTGLPRMVQGTFSRDGEFSPDANMVQSRRGRSSRTNVHLSFDNNVLDLSIIKALAGRLGIMPQAAALALKTLLIGNPYHISQYESGIVTPSNVDQVMSRLSQMHKLRGVASTFHRNGEVEYTQRVEKPHYVTMLMLGVATMSGYPIIRLAEPHLCFLTGSCSGEEKLRASLKSCLQGDARSQRKKEADPAESSDSENDDTVCPTTRVPFAFVRNIFTRGPGGQSVPPPDSTYFLAHSSGFIVVEGASKPRLPFEFLVNISVNGRDPPTAVVVSGADIISNLLWCARNLPSGCAFVRTTLFSAAANRYGQVVWSDKCHSSTMTSSLRRDIGWKLGDDANMNRNCATEMATSSDIIGTQVHYLPEVVYPSEDSSVPFSSDVITHRDWSLDNVKVDPAVDSSIEWF